METVLDAVGIAGRVAAVRERIERAARASGRSSSAITLIAVTKTVDAAVAREAVAAGAAALGENRVQELAAKTRALEDMPQIQWHMIGHLQRNKAAKAVECAGTIHGIDSVELAGLVSAAATRLGRTLDAFAQVNVSGEPSKSGFTPETFLAGASGLAILPGLRWRGLMTIAPEGASPHALRDVFAALRGLSERATAFDPAHWNALSMGMTDDFELAIAEGATHVRIGRAIFGERSRAAVGVTV